MMRPFAKSVFSFMLERLLTVCSRRLMLAPKAERASPIFWEKVSSSPMAAVALVWSPIPATTAAPLAPLPVPSTSFKAVARLPLAARVSFSLALPPIWKVTSPWNAPTAPEVPLSRFWPPKVVLPVILSSSARSSVNSAFIALRSSVVLVPFAD
ncbi:hypothetical protein D3C80_1407550 [compost metagenome]